MRGHALTSVPLGLALLTFAGFGRTHADVSEETNCEVSQQMAAKPDFAFIQKAVDVKPLDLPTKHKVIGATPAAIEAPAPVAPVAPLAVVQDRMAHTQLEDLKRLHLASMLADQGQGVATLATIWWAGRKRSEASLLSAGGRQSDAARATQSDGTELEATDVISLSVLVLVILLAAYFVWSRNSRKYEQDPTSSLSATQWNRSVNEAQSRFQPYAEQDPFQTQTKKPVCC
mmetsp:Transcript_2891/g.4462  ORF Transcript_2891/g.4462 Transcript_2891/m.4462 type:complete len:230 (-) Transcript_2891:63-752(-)